jgi:hypothetical protein
MGGIGSGRSGGRPTVDSMPALRVGYLQSHRALVEGAAFTLTGGDRCHTFTSAGGRLIVQSAGMPQYSVPLDVVPCGRGSRVWFRCPVQSCGRRAGVLYAGKVFACRRCFNLAYRCQRETAENRARRRAERIRHRLGWPAGILAGDGERPKGMHQTTFERLTVAHDHFVVQSLAGLLVRYKVLDRQ